MNVHVVYYCTCMGMLTLEPCSPGGTAGEEHHFVIFLVVKEIVEGPEAAGFTVGVRVQIRVVAGEGESGREGGREGGKGGKGNRGREGRGGRKREKEVG